MKKIIFVALLVVALAALVAVPALAKPGQVNIKRVVMAVGSGTLTIQTAQGETVTVTLPAGFDPAGLADGDWVMVKGSVQENGTILADRVKEIGPPDDDDDDDEDGEGRMNGAYCSGAKLDKPHPVAVKLMTQYPVTEAWIMGHFCSGHGMGAIMLALKTSGGDVAKANAMLEKRTSGMGWGQIWKEEKLIGDERNGESPPGWLKKPDHAGPKKNK